MLHRFDKHEVNGVKLNRLVTKYVLNRQRKFRLKIFLYYIDIAIFALEHLTICAWGVSHHRDG